jgi:hypothetical protein
MGERREPQATSGPMVEGRLIDQARAVHARLGQTFEQLLTRLGLTRTEYQAHLRQLEREPTTRRALDAARYGDRTPPRGRSSSPPAVPALPRNPRALRV